VTSAAQAEVETRLARAMHFLLAEGEYRLCRIAYAAPAEADGTNSSGTPAEAFLSDVSTDVHALLREITTFEKTITSVTAPQMAESILKAIFRSTPPCLSPSFRGTEAVGPLFRRRLNASVCEHFTLNKSRISCAQRPMEFMMRSNQGLAHTGVSRAHQADSHGPRTGLGAQ